MKQNSIIDEKFIEELKGSFPMIDRIQNYEEVVWLNKSSIPFNSAIKECPLTLDDVIDAKDRLDRFANYFVKAFPETKSTNGIIESPLVQIPNMKSYLEKEYSCNISGDLWIKLDSHLPISGSIKARGGIYEVLTFAEKIALEAGLLHILDNYEILDSPKFKALFSNYSIAVGSTGNLGLSIGIISAKLGFKVTVHMSSDARQWKKDLLREKGVNVVEYDSDYSVAVANGREQAQKDKNCYFIDDENSKTLFLGYAVAAFRLKEQFEKNNILVDKSHPLFVFLPCGVGGGPGGVAFGLKLVFKDNVYCFFAEPTHSCCMLLGMYTGLNDKISVQDLGLDNKTAADGLAVGRASKFVGNVMSPFISGCYSVNDSRMYRLLSELADTENIYIEPSATVGLYGPVLSSKNTDMKNLFSALGIDKDSKETPTYLAWATGGNMVPREEIHKYYTIGNSTRM